MQFHAKTTPGTSVECPLVVNFPNAGWDLIKRLSSRFWVITMYSLLQSASQVFEKLNVLNLLYRNGLFFFSLRFYDKVAGFGERN